MTLSFHPVLRAVLASSLIGLSALAADSWERDFRSPPQDTRPRCYWYWMDGVFSKDGITRDLEAMKQVGIGEAYIGVIAGQGGPGTNDGLKALSEPWWDHLTHAVREGTRIGVDIGVFNCPGWSQSGGPWVRAEDSMRHLVSSELRVSGPARLDRIPVPAVKDFQRVAVLAWPAPLSDAETAASKGAKIVRDKRTITWETPEPYTVRSITVRPKGEVRVNADYQTSADGTVYQNIRAFEIDRHRLTPGVGPVPLAPVVIAVPPRTARFHRIRFAGDADIGEVDLSAAPRIEGIAEKSLAKVFQDPLPPFGFYSWPQQAEPEAPGLTVSPGKVVELTDQAKPDGSIGWKVPPGDWIVATFGMAPTGVRNSPAPAESTGLEVDKMNRVPLAAHFDAYVGELCRRLKPEERVALKHVVADSYEMGPQNWTDGFEKRFRAAYDYDPLPWLPVLSGRVVGTADESNRFLWDLRRLVADGIASEYVGGLRDLCHTEGLRMWLENYGHWGFPSEFLLYGGQSDEIGGEFWESGSLGGVELRAAASAAHIYHKNKVFAEAWTGGPSFTSTPWSLKKRGDWALCQGINQFVLHVSIHQPWEDRKPGVNAWFGTEFNRHNTWFGASKSWIDYQRRCTVLLQQGLHVADVAYFIGEDAPKMTGLCDPPLPDGYDYDCINADVLLRDAKARDGMLVLPHGTCYRVLVLPPGETMRPQVLRKIGDLAGSGVKVIGPRPVRAPGMKDYPRADREIQQLATELWGSGAINGGKDLAAVLESAGAGPDLSGIDPGEVLYVHRRDRNKHIYFLSNQTERDLDLTPLFRVHGLKPECWDPVSGSINHVAIYDESDRGTVVPLRLGARGSVFVVFREAADSARVVELVRDGKPVVSAKPEVIRPGPARQEGFTISCWALPEKETSLPREACSGISAMQDPRNEIMVPAHGDSLVPAGGHAGCGLAVGTNGVVVYEHGAGYFAPVLVHSAEVKAWTHIAVVYQNSRPTLYLNGRPVRLGQKGEKIPALSPFSNSFAGGLRGCRSLNRAVAQDEVSVWAENKPGMDFLPERLLADERGRVSLQASIGGNWEIRRADGSVETLNTVAAPADMPLAERWGLRFPFQSPDEKSFTFANPVSWTRMNDPRAVYHSGEAVYSTGFHLPDGARSSSIRVILDLGDVASLAEVTLNGKTSDVMWSAPWRIDISNMVRAGENKLEIRVWNTWHNRLLGRHLKIPGLPEPAPFVTTEPGFTQDARPLPAGLIGPVVLRFARRN